MAGKLPPGNNKYIPQTDKKAEKNSDIIERIKRFGYAVRETNEDHNWPETYILEKVTEKGLHIVILFRSSSHNEFEIYIQHELEIGTSKIYVDVFGSPALFLYLREIEQGATQFMNRLPYEMYQPNRGKSD